MSEFLDYHSLFVASGIVGGVLLMLVALRTRKPSPMPAMMPSSRLWPSSMPVRLAHSPFVRLGSGTLTHQAPAS